MAPPPPLQNTTHTPCLTGCVAHDEARLQVFARDALTAGVGLVAARVRSLQAPTLAAQPLFFSWGQRLLPAEGAAHVARGAFCVRSHYAAAAVLAVKA